MPTTGLSVAPSAVLLGKSRLRRSMEASKASIYVKNGHASRPEMLQQLIHLVPLPGRIRQAGQGHRLRACSRNS